MTSMFWGLSMKPKRKYSQTIVKGFHVSGIALDEGNSAKLYLTAEKQRYIVATVSKSIPQVQLDLNFGKGDNITFQAIGDANLSLIGYLHDMEESDDESFDEEEYDNLAQTLDGKKALTAEEEDDDDEDDEDFVGDEDLKKELSKATESDETDDDDEDDEDEEDEEQDDSEAESEEEEEEVPQPKKAKVENNAKKPAKEQNGVAKNDQKQKGKKDQKPVADQQKPAKQQQPGGERVITGGVKIEDVRVGNGPEAKSGKRVAVYYVGRFKSNNKTFDSMQKGAGFKFGLGSGEVIKGWDVGVVGMKVGGKRRITCPPHMAYGVRGQPPSIPPNSTLVFDVELKQIQ